MGASLTEAHSALVLCLRRWTPGGGASASPSSVGLLAAVLRAAAVAASVTPYARLANGPALIHNLLGALLPMLAPAAPPPTSGTGFSPGGEPHHQQQVQIAALHFCAAVFVNEAAGGAVALPVARASAAPAETATPAAARIVSALMAWCSAPLTSVLRAEILAVLAKATRSHAYAIAAAWPALCPVVLQAFGDSAPAVRSTALRIIEELLRARSVALSPAVSASAGGDDGGAGAGADGAEGDGAEGDGGGPPHAAGASRHVDIWEAFGTPLPPAAGRGGGSVPPATAAAAHVTVPLLLEHYLGRALRDPSPAVRAAAAMSISHTLPRDWEPVVESACTAAAAAAAAASQPPPASPDRPLAPLLQALAAACADQAPSVRQAAARAWGAFMCHEAWRDPPLARFAAALLLRLLEGDESVAVRARASWAIGNLCAPPSAVPHAAATSTAPPPGTPLLRLVPGGVASALAPSAGAPSPASLASPPPLTLPRDDADALIGGAVEAPSAAAVDAAAGAGVGARAMLSSLFPQATRLASADFDAPDAALGDMATPPMAMFRPGHSQAQLVDLLSVGLVRAVLRASLRGAVDSEKVSCTAVRTLGFGVQVMGGGACVALRCCGLD